MPSCEKTDDSLGCEQLSPREEGDLVDDASGGASPLEEISLNARPHGLVTR